MELHPVVSKRRTEFYRQFKVDKVASSRLTEAVNWRLHGTGLVYAVASKRSSAVDLRHFADANPGAVVRQQSVAENVVVMVFDR
jgi:hypothetical protein